MKRSFFDALGDDREAKRMAMHAHMYSHPQHAAHPAAFAFGGNAAMSHAPMAQDEPMLPMLHAGPTDWNDGTMGEVSSDDERDFAGENFRYHEQWWNDYMGQVARGAIVMEQGMAL